VRLETKNPEYPDPYPEHLNHYSPGVSRAMAGVSGPLPVRPVIRPVRPILPSPNTTRVEILAAQKLAHQLKTLFEPNSEVHIERFDQRKSLKTS